jgi:hypothetical protein
MKKGLGVALLLLPLLAASARADGFNLCLPCCFPKFNCCGCNHNTPPQCGPWYLYWPLEAHFQTPAMPQYPYWPSPLGLAAGVGIPGPVTAGAPMGCCPMGGCAPMAAAQQPANFHAPATVQPVGYYQQVPSYWYGR